MFKFIIDNCNYSHVHFIGIGGISMSGLAEILLTEGYKVSGSDSKNSDIVKKLKSKGANTYIGHSKENIQNPDLVVYTDAISNDNEEFLEAKNKGITTVDRATFLGALMMNYKDSIAISGTHGKTSSTSMIATIFNSSTLDPTILLGGNLDSINGNTRLGNKEHLLTEACEYKGNILKYHPTIAVILNMEEEHLDYFKNIDHIVDTFVEYGRNIQDNGTLIINADDKHAGKVIESTKANVITFGIYNKSDYAAEDISFSKDGYPIFTLKIKGKTIQTVHLKVMGIHNVYNTLASIATSHTLGVPIDTIINAMEGYLGTHRRLEVKGSINNIKIVDDYAHHPTEIKASLDALQNSTGEDIWCVFQPHTYTRTRLLLNEFVTAFADAHKVIVPDIYAAREKDNGSIHSRDLVNALIAKGIDAEYMPSFIDIENYLLDHVKEGDTIVTMGASNVFTIGESILKGKEKQVV